MAKFGIAAFAPSSRFGSSDDKRTFFAFLASERGLLLILASLYVVCYLVDPGRPSFHRVDEINWWTWWDQGLYLKSAEAFARWDLSPSQHWYPLLYPLLAAPFTKLTATHPFLLIDLACFLLAAWLFAEVAAAFAVKRTTALVLFLVCYLGDYFVFREWLIPWTTTPVVVCVFAALYVAVREPTPSLGAMVLVGLCSGLTPITRPSDAIIMAALDAAVAIRCLVELRIATSLRLLGVAAAAGGCVLGAYALLHLSIYGAQLSEYQVAASQTGFNFSLFFEKFYALVVDPTPLWSSGHGPFWYSRHGLGQWSPWWFLAPTGAVIAVLRRGRLFVVVALVVAIDLALYTAYGDMFPPGLWRYENVHYFMVAYPLIALAAWIGFAEAARDRKAAIFMIGGVLLLLAIRLEGQSTPVAIERIDANRILVRHDDDAPFRSLRLRPVDLSFDDVYFKKELVDADGARICENLNGCRFVAGSGELVVVFDAPIRARRLTLTLDRAPNSSDSSPPLQGEAIAYRFVVGVPRPPGL